MFIRSSGAISNSVALITLGHTCRYVVAETEGCILIDVGLTAHVPALLQRLASFGYSPKDIKMVLCTHLHADRIAAIASLRTLNPSIKVVGSLEMQRSLSSAACEFIYAEDIALSKAYSSTSKHLSLTQFKDNLTIDETCKPGDNIAVSGGLELRAFSAPGHTQSSLWYFIMPHRIVIGDEGIGYYRGSELSAPGADWDLAQGVNTLKQLGNHEIHGIGFSCMGFLTGDRARTYASELVQNINDLTQECDHAFQQGYPALYIKNSIFDGLYNIDTSDPTVQSAARNSFESTWTQLLKRQAPDKEEIDH